MPSLDKLSYLSAHPIDKIVQEGEITIVNDGDTTSSGTDTGPYSLKIVQENQANNYGRAGFINARWSVDNRETWREQNGYLMGFFLITDIPLQPHLPERNIDSAISVGSSNTQIFFRTGNGVHGNVDYSTEEYTPISRTFIIQWWMYERD